jgi:hypothetical protein
MNRRNFIKLSGAMSLAMPLAGCVTGTHASRQAGSTPTTETVATRDYYELRQYVMGTAEQKMAFDEFLKNAAIPALNRMGIQPVGVFYPSEGFSPVYTLFRHKSVESMVAMRQMLGADAVFREKGAAHLDATAEKPAYKRYEASFLIAFKGMPHLEIPAKSPGRVFQLRTYESPSLKTGAKKIEMFNDAGEIRIFREVGLNPVFFGETLIGTKMPNLTYMLGFESMDQQKAAWKKFGEHPDWIKLRGMPEYSDKAILCGITNLSLVAAAYSQI